MYLCYGWSSKHQCIQIQSVTLLQNPDDDVRRNNEVKFGRQVTDLVTRVGNVLGYFKPQTLVRK